MGKIDIIAVATAMAFCLVGAPAAADAGETAVSWNIGATTVTATLTLPDGPGPHPAVVFVAGSGPTDRDWNSPLMPGRNGTAPLLAAELAKAGFASIRYDKRFLGPYAAGNMQVLMGKLSFESHAEEVNSAVSCLKGRLDIAPDRIYALTNSEGALHAINSQLRNKYFRGLVLGAPPGRPLKELLRAQIAAQVVSLPGSGEIMAGFDRLIERFGKGEPFSPEPAVPAPLNGLIQGMLYNPANLPFMRELLSADPARLLSGTNAPALVIIGKKDIQVDWKEDGAALERYAPEKASFVYPSDADHILKHEPRPREELTAEAGLQYNAEGRALDGAAADSIISWLKAENAR
jgi:pimeloyl-ACP methyl ester carboxylesterase